MRMVAPRTVMLSIAVASLVAFVIAAVRRLVGAAVERRHLHLALELQKSLCRGP